MVWSTSLCVYCITLHTTQQDDALIESTSVQRPVYNTWMRNAQGWFTGSHDCHNLICHKQSPTNNVHIPQIRIVVLTFSVVLFVRVHWHLLIWTLHILINPCMQTVFLKTHNTVTQKYFNNVFHTLVIILIKINCYFLVNSSLTFCHLLFIFFLSFVQLIYQIIRPVVFRLKITWQWQGKPKADVWRNWGQEWHWCNP